MPTISDMLAAAQARGAEKKLSYDGEVVPAEAYELLETAPGAKLVDVRTRAEWDYVGRIPGAVEIEWESYPDGKPNPYFVEPLLRSGTTRAITCSRASRERRTPTVTATQWAAGARQDCRGFSPSEKRDRKA
jgi:rhodanese-related sulfurtransferase